MKTPFYKRRKFWLIVSIVIVIIGAVGLYAYNRVMNTRVKNDGNDGHVFIKTGDTYEDVLHQLVQNGFVKDEELFDFLAQRANYPAMVKPGKYRLSKDLTYIDAIIHLRSGRQEEVKVVINGMITKRQLVSSVASKLNMDSIALINMLDDTAYLSRFDLNDETALCLFIPNTYNFYWNTSAEQFMQRMKKEYDKFWDDKKLLKAKAIGLTPVEVSILASIVDGEIRKVDEASIVAGLYLNRLKINMPLQSDPTVKYALRNNTIQRLSEEDTKIEHPYNTYWITGLPPGPIALPTQQAIIAVLNPSKHNHFYMCAKEDLSGYHNFTHNYDQHCLNARRYHLELDKRGIR